MCDRWLKFENFLSDMGLRPSDSSTLERINNTEGYGPENCVWASMEIQARNKCNNRNLTYKSEVVCITDLSRRFGVDVATLSSRLNKGEGVESAVSRPVMRRYINYLGITCPLSVWGKFFQIDHATLSQRLDRGWDIETALRTPPRSRKTKSQNFSSTVQRISDVPPPLCPEYHSV